MNINECFDVTWLYYLLIMFVGWMGFQYGLYMGNLGMKLIGMSMFYMGFICLGVEIYNFLKRYKIVRRSGE